MVVTRTCRSGCGVQLSLLYRTGAGLVLSALLLPSIRFPLAHGLSNQQSMRLPPVSHAKATSALQNKEKPLAGGSQSSATVEGLKSSLASSLASCCAKALLQPFDTIKTVQQQVRSDLSFFEAVQMVVKRDGGAGFWELYAGLWVSAIGSMPAIGLYYGVYSYCKRIFIPQLQERFGSEQTKPLLSDEALKLIGVALSAACGNTLASFSRVPYEVVKQKLQTGQYTHTWVAIVSMFKAQGMRAFFPMGGVSIQMIRDIPYAIFTLLAYEILRDRWVTKAETQSPWRDMVAGATAGGFGTYMTNGLDVIKTRLQTDPDLYGGSIVKCVRATFEEGGASAFFRGVLARLMHKIPANGAFFVFYEMFCRLLHVGEGVTGGRS